VTLYDVGKMQVSVRPNQRGMEDSGCHSETDEADRDRGSHAGILSATGWGSKSRPHRSPAEAIIPAFRLFPYPAISYFK
jgi:hypothetical protein